GDLLTGLLRVVDHYAVQAAAQRQRASLLLFTLMVGGMIGLLSSAGAIRGLAQVMRQRVRSRRAGQAVAWLMGTIIFFADYVSAIIVGSCLRPLTDRLRISREKLAYLVDVTAAPLSAITLWSIWAPVEYDLLTQSLPTATTQVVMQLRQASMSFRLYPWLAVIFALLVLAMRRDFGPMLRAERRAVHFGQVACPRGRPDADFVEERLSIPAVQRPWGVALVPFVLLVLVAAGGIFITGTAPALPDTAPGTAHRIPSTTSFDLIASIHAAFLHTDYAQAMVWSALCGSVAALLLVVGRRLLPLSHAMEGWLRGVRAVLPACMILVASWSLGQACDDLDTGRYLLRWLPQDSWPMTWIPAGIFLCTAALSFAVGTSWGTMAMCFPVVASLATAAAGQAALPALIGAAAAGAVWGDHCSPLSDTTIVASMACSCDHRDHVRTQLPYALLVGSVSLVFGTLGTGFDLYPWWVALLLGTIALAALLQFYGKSAEISNAEKHSSSL
ncbi:MAG: Na+/H+ antiporter NhaC family protein, partial [Polyangiales bacterium]